MIGTRADLLKREEGVSAVEFALIAPVMLALLAAIVDFGTLVYTRAQLETAVSGATSYVLASSQDMEPGTALGVGETALRMIVSGAGDRTTGTATFNNGSSVTYADGSYQPAGGPLTQCHCPTTNAGTLSWGAAVTCGSVCADGGRAGQFVQLSAALPYSPLFLGYGLVEEGAMTVSTVVTLQ
ncbi:TadE/TadG family type IV pilus assembly protein [Pelagibacterium montanilacus]|uniref:TadE/TadG family type IV pilus assembly protein n=1 Tax=Pelagibacterium montanilacus TaxID=2185280 RepID=UPI0013DF7DAB|nr:TadE family protein [Pelagibacterium montanilacus]